jgi:hypothetical protein
MQEDQYTASSRLQYVQVPIVEPTTCAANYVRYTAITAQMICAGYKEGQRDSCQVNITFKIHYF